MIESAQGTDIAIAGATGYIGGRLVPRLLEEGYTVRCLVRSAGKLADRTWISNDRASIHQVDLSDATAVSESLRGCHAAFYLVHSMTSAGAAYANKDRQLALQFAKAASDSGVKRIIYLGGLGRI